MKEWGRKMRWVNLLDKVAFTIYIISSLGMIYIMIKINKNKEIFLKYIHAEYGNKNEIVSSEDVKQAQKKYNQLVNTHFKIGIIYAILSMISGAIFVLLR